MSVKIIFLGPESTGKSTISWEVATNYDATYVPEFARTYLAMHGLNYSNADVLNIAEMQARMELEAERTGKLVICDTDLITLKIWLTFYGWTVPEWIEQFIIQHKADKYILMYPDILWIADEQRKNPNDRLVLFALFEQVLLNLNANYTIVKGEGLQRLNASIAAIKAVI